MRIPPPVVAHRMLLSAALICFSGALMTGLPIAACFSSIAGLVGMISFMFGGFATATVVKELADQFLVSWESPWYVREGAWKYLIICLALLNGALLLIGQPLMNAWGLASAFPMIPRVLTALAVELVWIPILDWPKRPRRPTRIWSGWPPVFPPSVGPVDHGPSTPRYRPTRTARPCQGPRRIRKEE